MSERISVVWAHGFGSHPRIDPPSRAMRSIAAARGVDLVVPELSVQTGDVLTVLPLAEQAKQLRLALDTEPDAVVGHSQGVWVLAEALRTQPHRRVGRMVLCAPPLTSPTERFGKEFRVPGADEGHLAQEFGGAHLVKDGGERLGVPRLTVIPRSYWAEVDDPLFDPVGMTEDLLCRSLDPRIIVAGSDERLGGSEHEAMVRGVADTVPGFSAADIVTLPGANHFFTGCAQAIAQIAFDGLAA